MNLPNKLTLARIIMVPFFIAAFILGYYPVSLVLFCAASITDYFDGKIARERNLVTNFGKIMDPLADKILVYSALCLFIEADLIAAEPDALNDRDAFALEFEIRAAFIIADLDAYLIRAYCLAAPISESVHAKAGSHDAAPSFA